MGAVCYKPKPPTITKEEVLKALNDKIIKESISLFGHESHASDNTKATTIVKTDEQHVNLHKKLATGGRLTPHLQMDTAGDAGAMVGGDSRTATLQKTASVARMPMFNMMPKSDANLIQSVVSDKVQKFLQIKILGYYSSRDQVYDTLTQLSKQSLFFMRRNRELLEKSISKHHQERITLTSVKSIEEHQSGVNQIMKLSTKDIVTVSDDCYIKYWSLSVSPQNQANIKVDVSIPTETVTCMAATGPMMNNQKREYLVAGCHSGNLLIVNNSSVKAGMSVSQVKKEQISNAHYNLIRVVISLESTKHKYFASADVCGIVKLWTSAFKPSQVLEIDLEQAMSYNSMIELTDVLPQNSTSLIDTSMIACALKSQKIHLIVLIPSEQSYQIIRTIWTASQKPTCMIQISSKHIAVAVGSLREPANIEIHEINSPDPKLRKAPIATLAHHTNMIDSLLLIRIPQKGAYKESPYIQWIVSSSRDRKLVLWKLYDGLPMRRTYHNLQESMKKGSQSSRLLMSERLSAEDYNRNRSFQNQPQLQESSEEEDKSDNSLISAQKKLSQRIDEEDSEEKASDERAKVSFEQEQMIDYFYSVDSGHKDFFRSMIQTNNDMTLITGSEDKSIKIFTIASGGV